MNVGKFSILRLKYCNDKTATTFVQNHLNEARHDLALKRYLHSLKYKSQYSQGKFRKNIGNESEKSPTDLSTSWTSVV